MQNKLKETFEKSLKRRDFLKCLGILGITFGIPPVYTAFKREKLNKMHYVERTLPLIGTFFTITILDSSLSRAEEAIEKGYMFYSYGDAMLIL